MPPRAALSAVIALAAAACASDDPGSGRSEPDATVDAVVDARPSDAMPPDMAQPDAQPDMAQPDALADARLDMAPPDAAPLDLDLPDAGSGDAGPDPGPCLHPLHPDQDRPRVALVGFPFAAEVGVHGTTVGAFDVTPAGGLVPRDERVDLMSRPRRLRFLPSGEYAVALTEDGVVATLAVDPVLTLVDAVALPGTGWTDLAVDPDGAHVHAVRRDVGLDAGVYTLAVDCDAGLHPLAAHHPLRLADTLALMPGDPDRAVLIGGQTGFAPFDDDDTRLLERRRDGGWTERAAFDLWGDFIDTAGLAIAPDGLDALVPNGSPLSDEGGQVMVVGIEGDALVDRRRIEGMDDARAAWFHRGGTALVTRLLPGRVSVLRREAGDYVIIDELRYGAPEDLAMVQRGALDGLAVLPAVSGQAGSQLVTLRVGVEGVVDELGVLPLPAGGDNIPGCVAIAP